MLVHAQRVGAGLFDHGGEHHPPGVLHGLSADLHQRRLACVQRHRVVQHRGEVVLLGGDKVAVERTLSALLSAQRAVARDRRHIPRVLAQLASDLALQLWEGGGQPPGQLVAVGLRRRAAGGVTAAGHAHAAVAQQQRVSGVYLRAVATNAHAGAHKPVQTVKQVAGQRVVVRTESARHEV